MTHGASSEGPSQYFRDSINDTQVVYDRDDDTIYIGRGQEYDVPEDVSVVTADGELRMKSQARFGSGGQDVPAREAWRELEELLEEVQDEDNRRG